TGKPRAARISPSGSTGRAGGGDADVETNIGVWLDQTLRVGACGTWWTAGSASGQPMALLQLEPELIIQPAARDRIATAVAAVRTINPAGVLRTTELLVD